MTPQDLLDAARRLVEQPRDDTGGLWGRAATLLARQALEQRMCEVLTARAPGSQEAPFAAQLLILSEVLGDRDLAARTGYAWDALSEASHHHGCELPATVEELHDWIETVARFLA